MAKRERPSLLETLLSRLRPNRKPPAPALKPRPFQAISIHHGTVCCAAAKEIDGVRFLAHRAPPLPLADCTMRSTCKCSYLKHSDRRGDARRMTDFGIKQPLFGSKERRRAQGRRAKD